MIKHGKIHPFIKRGATHLEPVREYITKGIADATAKISLQPERCDIRGAKRRNGQQCVVARVINRKIHPDAVAVGRAYTWIIVDGVGIRFRNPQTLTKYIEVFDEHGKASTMPVELWPITPNGRLRCKQIRSSKPRPAKTRRPVMKKIGVRAIGGGMTA